MGPEAFQQNRTIRDFARLVRPPGQTGMETFGYLAAGAQIRTTLVAISTIFGSSALQGTNGSGWVGATRYPITEVARALWLAYITPQACLQQQIHLVAEKAERTGREVMATSGSSEVGATVRPARFFEP